ncbi:MAG TPA: antitoxin MazE family protein [Allosphingosinicella sp.]|nr:antitoxin MazE family protein [Allosphingosinicella sp.]
MGKHQPLTNRERVAKHRAALRAQGLRPRQIWVPDVRSPEFIAEARRQSRIIAKRMADSDDLAFAEALQFWPEEGREDA